MTSHKCFYGVQSAQWGSCGEGNHLHTAPVLSNPPLF